VKGDGLLWVFAAFIAGCIVGGIAISYLISP
jgi:hypothetical protein